MNTLARESKEEPPHVVVRGNANGFRQEVVSGRHHLQADEPAAAGGNDAAPGPYDYLLIALGVRFDDRVTGKVEEFCKHGKIVHVDIDASELNKNNVRLEVIGQIYRLPENVQEHLQRSIATLSKNNGLTLVMALSYGSRIEIVEAVRSIAEKVKRGKLEPADISEKVISENLWTRNIPDPDLLIRTSGEMRVSNFLLWQISYAELVITPTFWPDFRKAQFYAALEEYARRHRRFGGV